MRAVIGGFALLLAVGATGCTTSVPQPGTPGGPGGSAGGTGGAGGGQAVAALLSPAGRAAAGLLLIGQIGQSRGVSEQVKTLAGQLVTEGQNLTTQFEKVATAANATLDTSASPDLTSTLQDLFTRSTDLDAAWLKAAADQIAATRAALTTILNSPEATEDAKTAARDSLARLDALQNTSGQANTAAGTAPPTQVSAGDGGQAAEPAGWVTVAGIGLLGLGAALVGGALYRRRVTG